MKIKYSVSREASFNDQSAFQMNACVVVADDGEGHRAAYMTPPGSGKWSDREAIKNAAYFLQPRIEGLRMGAPTTFAEYQERARLLTYPEGFGIDGLVNHQACPWCAAPDFFVFKLMEMHEVVSQDHTCAECGRTGRCLITGDALSTRIEFVQTGGDDPPDYFTDPPRRLTGLA